MVWSTSAPSSQVFYAPCLRSLSVKPAPSAPSSCWTGYGTPAAPLLKRGPPIGPLITTSDPSGNIICGSFGNRQKWQFGNDEVAFCPFLQVFRACGCGGSCCQKWALTHFQVSTGERRRTDSHTAMEVTGGIVPFENVPELADQERGDGIVVHWGGRSLLHSIEQGHVEIARWLYQNTPHKLDNGEVRWGWNTRYEFLTWNLPGFSCHQGDQLWSFRTTTHTRTQW